MAWWMLRQPVALSSDDALFFARGLEHFSVLEFSPHFPGYPGFIALGRLLRLFTGPAETALFLLSVLSALAIPPVCGWVAWRWTQDHRAALLAFVGALAQPLLPALGLDMLSDSSGLLFLLLFLGAVTGPHWGGAGLLLGMAACCRPSYAVMILAALAVAAGSDRRRGPALVAGFTLICALAFGAVLAWEGWSYVDEGLRFMSGHTTVWGNTAFARSGSPAGWLTVAMAQPLLMVPLVLGLRAAASAPRAAAAALIAGLAWTIALQNPDNLRHSAPVLVLAGLVAVTGRTRLYAGLVVVTANLAVLLPSTHWQPSLPPLAAATQVLAAEAAGTVITNHGVALLRRDLIGQRVMDAYYGADAAFAEANGSAPLWRLSSTPPIDAATSRAFTGRFLGERPLWLQSLRADPAP